MQTFKKRLAKLFGLTTLAIGLPTYIYVDQVYTQRLRDDKLEGLHSLAVSVAAVLSENLKERQREISLLAEAPYLKNGPIDAPQLEHVLDRLKETYPNYAWIGYADVSGKVLASTNGLLVKADVSTRPWFIQGQTGQYVGDLHEALLLSKHLPAPADGRAIRFIDFTAPVVGADGTLRGVLGAHAHWAWADDVTQILRTNRITSGDIDIYIVNKDGVVIYPETTGTEVRPPASVLQTAFTTDSWNGSRPYASAFAPLTEPLSTSSLGWKVVARQPMDSILADVKALKETLLAVVLTAALLLIVLIGYLASRLSQPVEQLSRFARRIEEGDEQIDLNTETQTTEIQQTLHSVKRIAQTLIDRKTALLEANRDLEHRIAERTAELQQHKHHLEDLVIERTRELASARDRAEAAHQAKNLLLANISHELRTPLHHITSLNSLMKREVAAPRALDRIEKIHQASQRLAKLINNLLDTVHTETAQLEITPQDFELAELLRQIDQSSHGALASKGFSLETRVSAEMPDRLHGDMNRLAQVTTELIDNAIKFSDTGPVILRIHAPLTEGSHLRVRFEVEDKGIGIPVELQEHIFELFTQGDPSPTRKYGGVGLGLQLCKRLVDLMAGEIGLNRNTGQGCLFWVEVPLMLGQARPVTSSGALPQNWKMIQEDVAPVLTLLELGDVAAQPAWDALAPRIRHLLGSDHEACNTAVANYDFETALTILTRAIEKTAPGDGSTG